MSAADPIDLNGFPQLHHSLQALRHSRPSRFSTRRTRTGKHTRAASNTTINNNSTLMNIPCTLTCFSITDASVPIRPLPPPLSRCSSQSTPTHLCFHHPYNQSPFIHRLRVPEPPRARRNLVTMAKMAVTYAYPAVARAI